MIENKGNADMGNEAKSNADKRQRSRRHSAQPRGNAVEGNAAKARAMFQGKGQHSQGATQPRATYADSIRPRETPAETTKENPGGCRAVR